ncbi:hypothetical protein [Nitrospirillum amazonense]|uniref:hypothetical protein n=1 Tax=Nitrospirillum amazonense TaxID=28077 RepID=UPI00241274C6|nr:hypothetical protein [Nitrospirillum amazonense]MDG3442470.1 hypothetical protein [Nitrospirillum amazonense]
MDAAKYVGGSGNIRFGLGHMDVLVADLRALADGIEGGTVIVQAVSTDQAADRQDFPVTALSLKFHHARVQPVAVFEADRLMTGLDAAAHR